MIRTDGARHTEEGALPRVSGIAIASGKGGVGKTNVVANLAAALSAAGERVLVLDADFGLSNLDVLLGLCPRYHVGHFLTGEKRLDEIIVDGPGGLRILPAASGIQGLTVLSEHHRRRLVEGLDRLEDVPDWLFVDTSAGISENVTGLMAACSRSIVVTDPEPTSLVDAYALIKVMRALHPSGSLELLVNSVGTRTEAEQIHENVQAATEHFLGFRLELFGWIERDPSVSRAVRRQKLVVLDQPDGLAAQAFHRLARGLLASRERGSLGRGDVLPFPPATTVHELG